MRNRRLALGLVATATAALALASTAPVAQAAPQPSTKAAAAGCRTIDSRWMPLRAATVVLERCDEGYHAKLSGGRKGEQLYLRSGAGTITYLTTLPAGGAGWWTTEYVGNFGGPWAACAQLKDLAEVCTSHVW